jgi:competence protein ComEC
VALWGGREIMMLALASLIAGLATTPYAAFHFHRVTPYGVLANLAAMPVVSAVVMPAGIVGLLAMPFGLDGVCWWAMGVGIDWMIVVTKWVAALPGAIGRMAAFGIGPLIAASIGIVLFGLLRTPLRWTGAIVLVLSTIWALAVPQPEILISGDGRNVAVRGQDSRLHFMKSAKDAFLIREWLAADADPRLPVDASLTDGISCDEAGCVAQMAGGAFVTLALRPEALGGKTCPVRLPRTGDHLGASATAGRDDAAAVARRVCHRRRQTERVRPAVVAGDRRRRRFRIEFCAFHHAAGSGRDAVRNRLAVGRLRPAKRPRLAPRPV